MGVGTIVYAPSFLGFLVETRGYSGRSGPLSREIAVESNAFHPYATATLASPHLVMIKHADLWGNFDGASRTLWSYTDPTTCSLYIAPTLLLLALLAPLLAPRDRFRWFLWAWGSFAWPPRWAGRCQSGLALRPAAADARFPALVGHPGVFPVHRRRARDAGLPGSRRGASAAGSGGLESPGLRWR